MEGKGCCAVPAMEQKKEGACAPKDCGPKKGCCGTVIKGMLLGGIVAFLWFSVSWMVLPFHMKTMQGFKNEAAVAKVLSAGADKAGIYMLPFVSDPSQKPAIDKPYAFVAYLPDGFDCLKNMQGQLIKQFIGALLLGGLLTCLLKKQSSGCPVAFSMKVGLVGALMHNVPDYIWWHFPAGFTLLSAVDDVVATTLAGFVISKFVLKCGKGGMCPGCGCTDCKCKAGGSCAA